MSSNFHKITVLNLGVDLIESNPKLASMATMLKSFGAGKSAIENLPKEEIRILNTDKIYGISSIMKTGLEGDDRLCVKLYLSPDKYWVVKADDSLKELTNSL